MLLYFTCCIGIILKKDQQNPSITKTLLGFQVIITTFGRRASTIPQEMKKVPIMIWFIHNNLEIFAFTMLPTLLPLQGRNRCRDQEVVLKTINPFAIFVGSFVANIQIFWMHEMTTCYYSIIILKKGGKAQQLILLQENIQ